MFLGITVASSSSALRQKLIFPPYSLNYHAEDCILLENNSFFGEGMREEIESRANFLASEKDFVFLEHAKIV